MHTNNKQEGARRSSYNQQFIIIVTATRVPGSILRDFLMFKGVQCFSKLDGKNRQIQSRLAFRAKKV